MTVFKRGWRALVSATGPAPPAPTTPAGADAQDTPAALLEAVYSLNLYINRHSGRMPAQSTVTARLITDAVRAVIDTSAIRPLDIYAVVSIRGILNDYLPTSLRTFLALDASQVAVARPHGGTPIESLQEQLESMLTAANSVLVAARDQDADALLTQGNFLSTKFSRSDLEL